jgi:hypothetical protein
VIPSRYLPSASDAHSSAVCPRPMVRGTAASPSVRPLQSSRPLFGLPKSVLLHTRIPVYIAMATPFRTQRAKNGPKCVVLWPRTVVALVELLVQDPWRSS